MIVILYCCENKFESEVSEMGSILNISEEEILALVEKMLTVFKQIMAWLGILVLPEDGELPTQPTEETTTVTEG